MPSIQIMRIMTIAIKSIFILIHLFKDNIRSFKRRNSRDTGHYFLTSKRKSWLRTKAFINIFSSLFYCTDACSTNTSIASWMHFYISTSHLTQKCFSESRWKFFFSMIFSIFYNYFHSFLGFWYSFYLFWNSFFFSSLEMENLGFNVLSC